MENVENYMPGQILLTEFMEPISLSANKLASYLQVPSNRILDIIRGRRAITPDTAIRLSVFFGNTPEFWMDLQQRYDLKQAENPAHYLSTRFPIQQQMNFPEVIDDPACEFEFTFIRVGYLRLMTRFGDRFYVTLVRDKVQKTLYWTADDGKNQFIATEAKFSRLPQTIGELRFRLKRLFAEGYRPYEVSPNMEFLIEALDKNWNLYDSQKKLALEQEQTISDLSESQIIDFRTILERISQIILDAYSIGFVPHVVARKVRMALKQFMLAQLLSDYDFELKETSDEAKYHAELLLAIVNVPQMDFHLIASEKLVQMYKLGDFGTRNKIAEFARNTGWKWAGQYKETNIPVFANQDLLRLSPIGQLSIDEKNINIQMIGGDFSAGQTITLTANNWLKSEFQFMENLQKREQYREFKYLSFENSFSEPIYFVAKVVGCTMRQTEQNRSFPCFELKVIE